MQNQLGKAMTVVEKVLIISLAGLLITQILAEGISSQRMLLEGPNFILLLVTVALIFVQFDRRLHELKALIPSLRYLSVVFFYSIVQCLLGGTLMFIGIQTAWILFMSIPALVFLSFSNQPFSLHFQRIFMVFSSIYLGLLVFLEVPFEISLICLLSLMLGLLSQHQLDIRAHVNTS